MEYVYLLLFVIVCANGCMDFPKKPWVREAARAAAAASEDDEEDGIEGMKIHYSDYVVFAQVVDLRPDPVFNRDGVEAAEVDNICIYKGGRLPERITIVGTANENNEIPGCPSTNLTVGMSYVFFLNKNSGNHFEVEFEPLYGEAEIILDDLTIFCGLKLEMPLGLPNNTNCYEPLSLKEGCEPYDEPTLPTTEPTKTTAKTPKPNNNKGGKGDKINTDKEKEYETNPGKSKTEGGKASGSKDDNSTSRLYTSWTLLIVSLILLFL